KYTN
ncbi:N-acetylmuramoyl-L-alanine amidase AmiB precursor, partial [Haemophilus influenzae]